MAVLRSITRFPVRGRPGGSADELRAEPPPSREVLYALAELKSEGTGADSGASTHPHCDEAEPWYQKAAAADPSWGKPLYKLGLCARQRGDAESASAFMQKVVDMDP